MAERKPSALLQRMEGVTVALATPLTKTGRLDAPALKRLIERTIANGACCLFPLGWCGEQPMLPDEVREQVLRETCRIADGRLPVMAGVSEQSLPRALRWAKAAREAGADLILATPPYSYPMPQEWLVKYFTDLASQSRMPLVVYQNDEVGVRLEPRTIAKLPNVPGVIGIKAYMPFVQVQTAHHQAARKNRFAVMSGDESVFGPALLGGIRHFTMGGPGNLCLRACVDLYRTAVAGDWNGVADKHRRLVEFYDALYSPVPSAYVAVKYAMARLKICEPFVTPPLQPLTTDQKKAVEKALKEFSDVVDPV